MLPLRDMNPTRRFPVMTYALILINVLVFLWELRFSPEQLDATLNSLAVVPATAAAHPFDLATILDIIRSMFFHFHGGWLHLLGNMLYLYLFGDNVEDRLGRIMYLVLYFGSGFAAAWAQIVIDPTSTIVLVGASGAIAGVLGSYFLFFPGVRVKGIVPLTLIAFWTEWSAWIVIGLWLLVQLFNGVTSLGVAMSGDGVAFFGSHRRFCVRVAPDPSGHGRLSSNACRSAIWHALPTSRVKSLETRDWQKDFAPREC